MYIKVKVKPSQKREKIVKKSNDTYTISVKEPAHRNQANIRIREIIASIYKVNIKATRIISGHHSFSKILSVNI